MTYFSPHLFALAIMVLSAILQTPEKFTLNIKAITWIMPLFRGTLNNFLQAKLENSAQTLNAYHLEVELVIL